MGGLATLGAVTGSGSSRVIARLLSVQSQRSVPLTALACAELFKPQLVGVRAIPATKYPYLVASKDRRP